jgi:hypothetical protein
MPDNSHTSYKVRKITYDHFRKKKLFFISDDRDKVEESNTESGCLRMSFISQHWVFRMCSLVSTFVFNGSVAQQADDIMLYMKKEITHNHVIFN